MARMAGRGSQRTTHRKCAVAYTTRRTAAFALLLSACAPGTVVDHEAELEPRDRERIVGGANTAGDPAVVLLDLGPRGYCTGSVISPRVVLTAGHCLRDQRSDVIVRFGERFDDDAPIALAAVTRTRGSSDLGVLALNRTAPVQPLSVHVEALPEQIIGSHVRLVGFGSTAEESSDYGIKRVGRATVQFVGKREELRSDEIATATIPNGTCYGDSGGPNMMTIDGREQIVAVTSRGTGVCGSGLDIAVRTDPHAGFLADFLAEHDPANCALGDLCAPGCQADACVNTTGGGCATADSGSGTTGLFLALCGLCLAARRRRRQRLP